MMLAISVELMRGVVEPELIRGRQALITLADELQARVDQQSVELTAHPSVRGVPFLEVSLVTPITKLDNLIYFLRLSTAKVACAEGMGKRYRSLRAGCLRR
jgi:hypothetical protein